MPERTTIDVIADEHGDARVEVHTHPNGAVEIAVTDGVELVNVYLQADAIARLQQALTAATNEPGERANG